MNSDRSNNLSLKYLRSILSVCKEIKIRKFEFVVKTHFLTLQAGRDCTQKFDDLLCTQVYRVVDNSQSTYTLQKPKPNKPTDYR